MLGSAIENLRSDANNQSKEEGFLATSGLTLTAYLLHDGSASKWEERLKPLGVGAFHSWNLLVLPIGPETDRSSHEQVEESSSRPWRTEPTYVAKYGDDLWLGVKGQPRSDIAGFPRNLFQ